MYIRPDLTPDPTLSSQEMEARQREVAASAHFTDDLPFDVRGLTDPQAGGEPPVVAGVDQSFLTDEAGNKERAVSAIVVTRGSKVLQRVHAIADVETPYIPGLLSYREGEAIMAALEELSIEPDLFCFDGSGRIHYREAGIATHIGVLLDTPSIGITKQLLCGEPAAPTAGLGVGERIPITADDQQVEAPDGTVLGYAVQTRQYDSPDRKINPVYVSPGHRVGAETAADLAAALTTEYKLPEPIRLADAFADEAKQYYE